MSRRTLLITIAAILVAGIAVFTYLYLRGQEPLKLGGGIGGKVDLAEAPKFLYAINSEPGQQLQRPMAVYVFDNNIYVSDAGGAQVLVYNYNGKFIRRLQPPAGSGFRAPYGIVSDGGKLYVATKITSDTYNAVRVPALWTADAANIHGTTKPIWTNISQNSSHYKGGAHQPNCISVDAAGNIYIALQNQGVVVGRVD